MHSDSSAIVAIYARGVLYLESLNFWNPDNVITVVNKPDQLMSRWFGHHMHIPDT
jgi:hypothetical protein